MILTSALPWLPQLPSATAFFTATRAALPTPRPFTLVDVHLAFLVIALNVALLIPPPTRSVRLVRAAVAPFIVAAWLWFGYVPVLRSPQERWGTTLLLMNFSFRALETLVAFPPEFHCYRLRPPASGEMAEAEAVPAAWSWAKAQWALSLWWSWRGIGWNYGPPLASSMRAEPYTVTSSRRDYLVQRAIYLVGVYAVEDLCSTYMRLVAPDFFIAATTPYAALTTLQRALHSIAVVARILCSIEFTHVGCSLAAVAAGGYFGWDSELTTPWGWPPVFGSVKSIWQHPGLAYMWNRAWNQYNRRMLHCWAWVGICETLLRLTPSGESVKNPRPKPKSDSEATMLRKVLKNGHALKLKLPSTPPAEDNGNEQLSSVVVSPLPSPLPSPRSSLLSPPDSGRSTPAPYQPDARPPRASVFANLFKSLVVFTVSGLHHDWGSFVMLLDAVGRGEDVRWRTLFSLSPFFLAQPIALAIETVVKQRWRSYKKAHGWAPAQLTLFERIVGFTWTWLVLGWTAGWFVQGMARLHVWPHYPGKRFYSALWWVWGT